MSPNEFLIEPEALAAEPDIVVVDCRFSLADPDEGRRLFQAGHIPGASHLDLNRDLSSAPQTKDGRHPGGRHPGGRHPGGRHPLPDPAVLQQRLADSGIGPDTHVVAYDASRFAFAARLWWLMRSLGYRPPRLLNGGYDAWLATVGTVETATTANRPRASFTASVFSGCCDIDALPGAQSAGALLIDARETQRYEGVAEPIDPVAGHIPGAVNHPWQDVTGDDGRLQDLEKQRQQWGQTLDAPQLVVYCGSGVTACVNLFSLALLGRDDAMLYPGSWSDWCSYLP